MKNIKLIGLFFGILVAFAGQSFCQTNLQFTAVAATDEHAIRLTWSSQSNEVYEIDAADALIDTNTGSITWNKLYDEYPSQGTNTFVGDFGNYNLDPQILHPKDMPMRFYRIVDQGADTTSDEPIVSIISPTNGATVSDELTITVAASTDQPSLTGTKLYVDGQEMQMADSRTNYVDGSTNYEVDVYSINTCEWGNGPHTLFATARCASALEGAHDVGVITIGHAVSAFVPVTFNNLVTRISFSQPFFDPSVGQTQQVSAVFAANSDWTLTIRDVFSNAVRTVTGSGNSLQFNWDGNGDGGTNLPAGVYYYYISAETNGGSSMMMSGGGSFSSSAFAPVSGVEEATALWAVAPDSENVVPFAIYPPGFDTNSLTIFRATSSEVESLTALSSSESAVAMDSSISFAAHSGGGGMASPAAAPAPSSQPSPPSPQRPPTNPVRGVAGTFGIAYDTYTGNGTNGYSSITKPFTYPNGQPPSRITLEGHGSADSSPSFEPLKPYQTEANNFITAMQKGGWSKGFNKPDDKLSINDLRGSGTPFNSVNLGVLMLHGTFGTSLDYTAGGCQQMYFPITSGTSAQYVRMSEMNFGGAGTNGLKWMVISACYSLTHAKWSSMHSAGVQPINSNLHLILGADTIMYTDYNLMAYLAGDMFGDPTKSPPVAPLTVEQAWYDAGTRAYQGQHLSIVAPVIFAASGNDACLSDTLQTNSPPTGSYFYHTDTVYTP